MSCGTACLVFWRLKCSVLDRPVTTAGDNGKVEKRRSKIALHYVKGWFLFDIISSLPYEQMLQHDRWGVPTLVAILKASMHGYACRVWRGVCLYACAAVPGCETQPQWDTSLSLCACVQT